MAKLQLTAHQHYDDVGICVVPQLPQPPLDVLIGEVLGDVVHQEGAHCAAVVPAQGVRREEMADWGEEGEEDSRRGDGSVALLAGGVPDLSFDRLPVHL